MKGRSERSKQGRLSRLYKTELFLPGIAFLLLVTLFISVPGSGLLAQSEILPDSDESFDSPLPLPGDDVSPEVKLKAREILGPVAAIAISPFYGMALLSGIAILADREYIEGNEYLRRNPVLRNPAVFVVFAVLAFLISLPRFTKLTNTFGTFLAYLEDRAVFITLAILQLMLITQGAASPGGPSVETLFPLEIAGIAGLPEDLFTLESLWLLFALANYVIIRTVRFYFDVLILISPLPFVDGALETFKKIASSVMLTVYVFSPTAAAVMNFFILFLACLLFTHTLRQGYYYRAMLIDPILARLRKRLPEPGKLPRIRIPRSVLSQTSDGDMILAVFPMRRIGKIKAKTRCYLILPAGGEPTEGRVVSRRFPGGGESFALTGAEFYLGKGAFYNRLRLRRPGESGQGDGNDDDAFQAIFAFSSLYSPALDLIRERLNAEDEGDVDPVSRITGRLRRGYNRLAGSPERTPPALPEN